LQSVTGRQGVSPRNIAGLISDVSEEVATHITHEKLYNDLLQAADRGEVSALCLVDYVSSV